MSEVVLVELSALELAPENMREADPEALEALKRSIQAQGLLQNLVGYVDEEEGVVKVVAGGHRLRALKELGWAEKVPVRLVPREKAALLSLAENLARKELSPLEEAEAVARLLEQYAKEEVAKELGRSPAWVEARAKVAKDLVPEAKEALGRGEIGFGLAALLAELPEEDQRALWQAHGKALTPEMVRAWRAREAVPLSRALPGVAEKYRERGGVIEEGLFEGGAFTDRRLFLEVQAEAAKTLAERLGGDFLLDVPREEFVPHPGGATYVVLYSGTGEVKVYAGVRRRGERLTQEGGAEALTQEAQGEARESGAPEAPALPSLPKKTREWKPPLGEVKAMRARANRERVLRDARYRMAALVWGVMRAFHIVLDHRGHVPFRLDTYYPDGLEGKRWKALSGEEALLEELRALTQGVGERPTVEDLMRLPTLEEAFARAVALLVSLPAGAEPELRLELADEEHLRKYPSEVLEKAAREKGLAGKTKKEIAAKLAGLKGPFPEALLEALGERKKEEVRL